MKTLVISGFPGVGKTHYSRHAKIKTWDMDSMSYSWIEGKVGVDRNPDFPNNYIKAIKYMIGKMHIVFVSTHKEVRDALVEEKIPFVLVYPYKDLKGEYLERFIKRGSDENFVALMNDNWNIFLKQLTEQKDCTHFLLPKGKYVDSAVKYITQVLDPESFDTESIVDEISQLGPEDIEVIKEEAIESNCGAMVSTVKKGSTYYMGVDFAKTEEELKEKIPELRPLGKTITINGKAHSVKTPFLSYRDILTLAFDGTHMQSLCTVTYSMPDNEAGTLLPGDLVDVVDKLHIDCVYTNNA